MSGAQSSSCGDPSSSLPARIQILKGGCAPTSAPPSRLGAFTAVSPSSPAQSQRSVSEVSAHNHTVLHPSSVVGVEYRGDASRRDPWGTTKVEPAAPLGKPVKRSTGMYGDPLQKPTGRSADTGAALGRGVKVPYGPGFYIPPPGYQASALGSPKDLHVPSGKAAGSQAHYRKTTGPVVPEGEGFEHVGSNKAKPEQASGRTCDRELRVREQARPRGRNVRSSCKEVGSGCRDSTGSVLVWAAIAMLLSASQMQLVTFYERRQSTLCVAVSLAAQFLELYAILISLVRILVGRPHPGASLDPATAAVAQSKPSSQKNLERASTGLATKVLDSIPNMCGSMVCLGASAQLVSLPVFALQTSEPAIRYGMLVAVAIAVCTSLFYFGQSLLHSGLFCFGLPRHHKGRGDQGSQQAPTLPISGRDPPSRTSSTSSHSGKYKPDYGLDSDSDSDGYKPGFRHPRADWTDQTLDGLIRSPLLDMPSSHQ